MDTLQNYIEVFMRLFQGREDCFAVQTEQGGYYPKYYPIRKSEIEEHLFRHVMTYGVYLLRSDNTIMFSAIDIDIDPRKLTEVETNEGIAGRDRLYAIAKSEAKKQSDLLTNKFHLPNIIEFSGKKGYHIYFFFKDPIPAYFLLKLKDQLVLKRHPDITFDVKNGDQYEFFPKQAYASGKGLGNLIKMPLGKHQVSRKYSYLLNPNTMEEMFDALPFLVNVDKQYRIKGQYLEELVGEKMIYEVPKPTADHKTGSHGHLRSRFDFDIPTEESIKNVIVEIEGLLNHDPKNADGSYNFPNINKCPPCIFEAYFLSKTRKGQFESRAILVRYLANVKRTNGNFGFTPEEIAGFIQYRINDDEDRLHPERLKYYTAYFYGNLDEPNNMDSCMTLQKKGFCLNFNYTPIDPNSLTILTDFKDKIYQYNEYLHDIRDWQQKYDETKHPDYLEAVQQMIIIADALLNEIEDDYELFIKWYPCTRLWHPYSSNTIGDRIKFKQQQKKPSNDNDNNDSSSEIPLKDRDFSDLSLDEPEPDNNDEPELEVLESEPVNNYDYNKEENQFSTDLKQALQDFRNDTEHQCLFVTGGFGVSKTKTVKEFVYQTVQQHNEIIDWYANQNKSKPIAYINDDIKNNLFSASLFHNFLPKSIEEGKKDTWFCFLVDFWNLEYKNLDIFDVTQKENIPKILFEFFGCSVDGYKWDVIQPYYDPHKHMYNYDPDNNRYLCRAKEKDFARDCDNCWNCQIDKIKNIYDNKDPHFLMYNIRQKLIADAESVNNHANYIVIDEDQIDVLISDVSLSKSEFHELYCPIELNATQLQIQHGDITNQYPIFAIVENYQIPINWQKQKLWFLKYPIKYCQLERFYKGYEKNEIDVIYFFPTKELGVNELWIEAVNNNDELRLQSLLFEHGRLQIKHRSKLQFKEDQKVIFISGSMPIERVAEETDISIDKIKKFESTAFNNGRFQNPIIFFSTKGSHYNNEEEKKDNEMWGKGKIKSEFSKFVELNTIKQFSLHPLICCKKEFDSEKKCLRCGRKWNLIDIDESEVNQTILEEEEEDYNKHKLINKDNKEEDFFDLEPKIKKIEIECPYCHNKFKSKTFIVNGKTLRKNWDIVLGKDEYQLVTYPAIGSNSYYKWQKYNGEWREIDSVWILGRYGIDGLTRHIYETMGFSTDSFDIEQTIQTTARGLRQTNSTIPVFAFCDPSILKYFVNPKTPNNNIECNNKYYYIYPYNWFELFYNNFTLLWNEELFTLIKKYKIKKKDRNNFQEFIKITRKFWKI